jgi:hypothetical protein
MLLFILIRLPLGFPSLVFVHLILTWTVHLDVRGFTPVFLRSPHQEFSLMSMLRMAHLSLLVCFLAFLVSEDLLNIPTCLGMILRYIDINFTI